MLIYLAAIVMLLIVLVSHIFGTNGLYAQVDAYDIMMHMLGGVGIGLFVFALVNKRITGLTKKRGAIFLGVLIAGLIWEFFEVYYNIAGYSYGTRMYFVDTIKDIIDDLIGGGLIAYLAPKYTKDVEP